MSSEEDVDEAINYCKKALQVDSENIKANLIASKIFKDWAYYQTDHGNDPSIAAEKSTTSRSKKRSSLPKKQFKSIRRTFLRISLRTAP